MITIEIEFSYNAIPWQLWHSLCWAALLATIVRWLLSKTSTTKTDKAVKSVDSISESVAEVTSELIQVPDLIHTSDIGWNTDEDSSDDEDDSTVDAAAAVEEEEGEASGLAEVHDDDDTDDSDQQQQQQQQQHQQPQQQKEKEESLTATAPADPLSQLIDEDARDVDADELTTEQQMVVLHLIRMRYNLERYINQELAKLPGYDRCRRKDLARDITLLKYKGNFEEEFVKAMHKMRYYCNLAVHNRHHLLPTQEECTRAVREYVELKQRHKTTIIMQSTVMKETSQ